MKKVLGSIILVGTIAFTAMAIDDKDVYYTIQAGSTADYREMNEWLFGYMLNGVTSSDPQYGQIKQQWSSFGNELSARIKADFTIDPTITEAVNKLRTDFNAKVEADVKALGFESYNVLYGKLKYQEITKTPEIEAFLLEFDRARKEMELSQQALTQAYNDEFKRRFEAAFVDAVKKLQENSASMK